MKKKKRKSILKTETYDSYILIPMLVLFLAFHPMKKNHKNNKKITNRQYLSNIIPYEELNNIFKV